MKKLLALLTILLLTIPSCEQQGDNSTPDSKFQNITIRNQSSYDLTNVKFSGTTFATSGSNNELSRNTNATKPFAKTDAEQAGYITFTRKDIGIDLRTAVPISFADYDYVFSINNNTLVQELGNTSNQKTLAAIAFLPKIVLEYADGINIPNGDLVPLEESVVNIPKQTTFTLHNIGSGVLILTGSNPVTVTGGGDGIFSAVRPTESEIPSNSSLTFKISFIPQAIQTYSATVTVKSNDPGGDFTFIVTTKGVPSKPIASIFHGEHTIPQNSTINAGDVLMTLSEDITVIIKNSGTELLTLDTANIDIIGDNREAFALFTTPSSSISVDGQTSFVITCTPVKVGENNSTLLIPTNDDDRNPITVLLRVTGIATYAVTFNANGGLPIPASQVIVQGEKIIRPMSITRTGHTFDGWYKEATFINMWNFTSDIVTSDIILYARWTPIPINVQVTSVTDSSVSLAWNAIGIDGVNGYHIYRSASANGTYDRITASAVTGTTFTDIGLDASTAYYYKVTAIIDGIEGELSNPVSAISATNVQGNGLAEKLSWLTANVVSGGMYFVEVDKDENIAPQVLSYSSTGITIILHGSDQIYTVNLSSNGSLFIIGSGVTLILDRNITLNGRENGNYSLVCVDNGGTLVMNEGTKIIGNRAIASYSASYGGGVYINRGSFTMNGGEISGNTVSTTTEPVSYSGWVYVLCGGIVDNDAPYSSYGGGVYISSGNFIMNGGKISGNRVTTNINSNSADSCGGGVYVGGSGSTFIMNGGEISGNTALSSASSSDSYSGGFGGGVCVIGSGNTFTMNGGEIAGNTAIAANSNDSHGGGVCVASGIFTITGGVIYGTNAITGLRNIAYDGAVLSKSGGVAEYGRFNGTTFSKLGNLDTTDTTIRVTNGYLLRE